MPPSAHPGTLLAPFQSLFSAPLGAKPNACSSEPCWPTDDAPSRPPCDTRGRAIPRRSVSTIRCSIVLAGPLSKAVAVCCPCWCRPSMPLAAASRSSLTKLWERRWGRRISKRGHYRDPLASSRKRTVSTSGLRWIVLTLVITPPWNSRCWALPIPGSSPGQALSVPAPTPQVSERLGLRHKTVAQWARQMIRVVRRWLPQVAITVLGDQSYSVVELGHACRQCEVRLIAPLRLDAVLHEAPPSRQPGTRGRPRRKGKRLPSLVERLRDAATPWQSLRVRWYDGRVRRLQISSGTALWYRSGQPVLPLRWVLVRPCDAQHPPRAFFSTCPGDRAGEYRGVFHQALEH